MNKEMRWKLFIDWWNHSDFSGLDKEELLDVIQEKISDLEDGR